MKRRELLRHLRTHGCQLLREGSRHSWWHNPTLNKRSAVPRHNDIDEDLARKICRDRGWLCRRFSCRSRAGYTGSWYCARELNAPRVCASEAGDAARGHGWRASQRDTQRPVGACHRGAAPQSCGIDFVVFRLTAVDGFHGEGRPQDKGHAFFSPEVSEPGPR